jgi:hypothetical protein
MISIIIGLATNTVFKVSKMVTAVKRFYKDTKKRAASFLYRWIYMGQPVSQTF